MGFQVFEEEETVEQVQEQVIQKSAPRSTSVMTPKNTSILGSKTHNMQKSNSAPSKLEDVHKAPKLNARRQALADAAALPPKKAAAAAKKSTIKKAEGMSVDELRRARRAEMHRKQGLYSAASDSNTAKKPKLSL